MSRWLRNLLAGSPRRAVGIDAETFAWREQDHVVLAGHEAGAGAIASAPGADRLHFVVSSDIAVHWIQVPPVGLASLPELRKTAAARCARLFGGSPESWWVAGDWHARRPFLCAALPRQLVDRVESSLGRSHARPRWMTAGSAMLQRHAPRLRTEGWSCFHSAGVVLCLHAHQGRFDETCTIRFPRDLGAKALGEFVRSRLDVETVRLGLSDAGELVWADPECETPGSSPTIARARIEAEAMLRLAECSAGGPA